MDDPAQQIRKLALEDGRYSPEAFRFLSEALVTAVKLAGKEERTGPERHVSGQEVLVGLRAHAVQLFGPLAPHVWRAWGVRDTLDWGRIVFLLVDHGQLKRQDQDTIEDFRGGFDFDAAFEADYRAALAQLLAGGRRRDGDN